MSHGRDALDLDRILKARGLKESDLCQVLGVSGRTVLFWRTGERRPSAERALKAERLLNIPRHELRPDLWSPPRRAAKPRFCHRLVGEFSLTSRPAAAAAR
jgi:transcriptional regulator with XRE-family HTH domain